MAIPHLTVLVIGSTGSIGRLVVAEAIRQGHIVRALARTSAKARLLPREAQVLLGDVTRPETLPGALDGIDTIVFTLGSDSAGKVGAENVYYGGVLNVLALLGSLKVRIALMTCIGVTNRTCSDKRITEDHDWKRRSERLVRASGLPYTIVRPGWFDHNGPNDHRLVLMQGDTCQTGSPSDGVIARRQLAEVLVHSLTSDEALNKTFELVAVYGTARGNLDALLSPLEADSPCALDCVHDTANMPFEKEPKRVRDDLKALRTQRALLTAFARGA
jgi:uncharacterized protein YbjT (DUF2867 family)